MPPIPYKTEVKDHPGSTLDEIWNEPDWNAGHAHRIGFNNKYGRYPGVTHGGDEGDSDDEADAEVEADLAVEGSDKDVKKKDELTNFRDVFNREKDLHLQRQEEQTIGWRSRLRTTEDFVRNEEDWPANVEKRKKEEEAKKKREEEERQKDDGDKRDNKQRDSKDKSGGPSDDKQQGQSDEKQPKQDDKKQQGDTNGDDKKGEEPKKEHEWKREEGDTKHHDAYATTSDDHKNEEQDDKKEEHKTEDEKLREKYSPQEIALLKMLKHEKDYVSRLQQNDGKGVSPMKDHNRSTISIDEADQFSPDNWIPRSSDLIRLTGKHPLNAEAHLSHLFDAGLITPNELHYVRNHGAVPYLRWDFHTIDVENGKLTLTMEALKHDFDSINIPVALACDGNRRKELNQIKKSKGFNWGSGAVSCAYWKGPLLRDVLLAAGVPENMHAGTSHEQARHWVNFEGADDPSEGKYATCIPLQYAMDATNDVILAYEMNDVPLPPDHGYPCRLMIPGYVGGRCVKWLSKIWISDTENTSHYHIWDNRVLPAFITEKDGEFAETMFAHPDTACNEQNLNSVIVKPAQGEKISLDRARKGNNYRIEGYAYDGGGHAVQRVEISLDDGDTWLYCIRKFPDAPIRHGQKFWTWVHWHVDVEITHLLQCKAITVRCFNVFKNTQPKEPSWNTMGMMNNCWYVVKTEISVDSASGMAAILFRHPTEPGTGDGGWMKPSQENMIAKVKQEAGTPQKQFTRQEIEKHNTEQDCWLVVDNKVYDVTSVLAWHPGGKAAVLGHAGKVHQETSNEFASIHDGFAYQKLKECVLGKVTEKAKQYIKKTAEAAAKEAAESQTQSDDILLQKHRWVPVTLTDRKSISKDTRTYTFTLPDGKKMLGLGTCQHVQIGYHFEDRMVIRSYTPTRPLMPAKKDDSDASKSDTSADADAQRDGAGTFDLTVKTYFPTSKQPGGALSNILDCMPLGEQVEIRGPTGDIVYNGNGDFTIEGRDRHFKRVSLVLGGSGITPGYALLVRVLLSAGDTTQLRVVDANKSEADILLKGALDGFEREHGRQLKVTHVLSHPGEEWKGKKGHVDADVIKEALFEPAEDSVVFLCGPPAMIQKAALPALTEWGYVEDENCFGF